ncbi:MAG: hypothetical protein GVY12_10535 [Bacteroidetes bacterium]|jgi:putative ribosome biogenesis GTPase RsgA|nr:hypothetical protein [Bacteroidota bacterium]
MTIGQHAQATAAVVGDRSTRQAATVANIAQKEKRLRIRNAISRPDLYRILTEMVRVAEQHPNISSGMLEDLKDGWKRISI